MTGRDEDRDLARLFEELRRVDDASAPPFRQVLEQARVRSASPAPSSARRLAFVMTLLVAVAVTVVLVRRPAAHSAPEARSVTLAEWKAPTDFLLRTPGSTLFDSVPQLSANVPDYSRLEVAGTAQGELR